MNRKSPAFVVTSTALGLASAAIALAIGCSSDEEGGKAAGGSGGFPGTGGNGAPGSGGSGAPGGANGSGGTAPNAGGGAQVAGGAGPGGAANAGGSNGGGAAGGGTGGDTGAGGSNAGGGPSACRAPTPRANPGNTCHGTPPPALKLTEVKRGFFKPVLLTHAPGDASRLYVVQVDGKIRVIKDGEIEAAPFLDLGSAVRVGGFAGEQGLLGLAFHPDFAQNGRFFVAYTANTGNGNNALAEYKANAGSAPTRVREIFSETHPSTFGNHNGGMLAFGPDGCLYTSLGDGGDGDDPGNRGQTLTEPLGSILRIDVDSPNPAPGNMTGGGVDPRTWDYGLRNPWRFSFDRATGDLYIGDVGQEAWEEVDVEPAGTGHVNYGWKVTEGKHCRGNGPATCDMSGKRMPAAEQNHPTNKAVIGGYVYRGSKIPGMVGRYLYGDSVSRKIWSFTYSGEDSGNPKVCDEADLGSLVPGGDITGFGEDSAGEIYVLTLEPGIVYRIDPA